MKMGLEIEIGGQIEKVNGKELNYGEFVRRYMEKNQPVLLTGLMDDWRACRDWVSQNGQPNLPLFSNRFGSSRVQVADCDAREYTDQKRVEMSVSQFVSHWLEGLRHCTNSSDQSEHRSVLYLKDWHFVKEYTEYEAYSTPTFFCDDWLNLYLDNYRMHVDPEAYQESNDICCSDYRFVYMGAKGSWTPLHADVFRSYSWSANVCGKKRWLFLSPSQSHLVFDRNGKNCVYDIFEQVNETRFPGFKKAIWLECLQDERDVIFVPSGWYHQVHNLEDTISINHNWYNAYNLSWVWKLLLRDYNESKEYIEDIKDICDDFEGLCQRNLAANTGMNFCDFFTFVTRLSLANLVLLYSFVGEYGAPDWSSCKVARHFALNLKSIREVAFEMRCISSTNAYHQDMIKTSKDPRFTRLCRGLGSAYRMINKEHYCWSEFEKAWKDDLRISSCKVRTPEDLVMFIDNAVARLGTAYGAELSELYGGHGPQDSV